MMVGKCFGRQDCWGDDGEDVLQKGIGLGERWRRLVTLIDSRNAWEHGGEAILRQEGCLGG